MPTMTGGRAVARAMLNEGIRVAFGIPGVHNIDLYEGIRDEPDLRHILARHEQGAAFMADGYGRATGEVGAVTTITGPGATNALTALGQAYSDHSPVLVVSSELDMPNVGKQRGELHEMRDQLGVMSGVTAWSRRVSSVEEIPWAIHEAMTSIRSRSPRPAYVEVPKDLLGTVGSPEFPSRAEVVRPEADADSIAQAAALLLAAERPMLHVGRGAVLSGADAEVRELAELIGAPVFTTGLGKGIIPDDHPLYVGLTNWGVEEWQAHLYRESDMVLVVGSRLGPLSTGYGRLGLPRRAIQVGLDKDETGRCFAADVTLIGDARQVLRQLIEAVRERGPVSRSEWAGQAREAYEAQVETWMKNHPRELGTVASLRAALPASGIVTNDMTVFCYWMMRHFQPDEPRSYLFPYHFGTLGFGLPAAVGAKIGCPDRPILAICGDGGFMFSVQELATAVKYGLSLTVLLCNDDCYTSVRLHQENKFPHPPCEVHITNPDFMLLAQAFGVRGIRLGSASEAGDAVKMALGEPGVTIVEMPIDFRLPN